MTKESDTSINNQGKFFGTKYIFMNWVIREKANPI